MLKTAFKHPRWLAVFYICLMSLGFSYGAWGLPWYVRHLTQLVLVGFGAIFILISGKTRRVGSLCELCAIIAPPFMLMLAYSMLCWALDMRALNYISRGTSTIIYCLISLLAMCVAVYFFGVKAIDFTLYSMCAANLSILAYAISSHGFNTFKREFYLYVISGGLETQPSVKILEVHDLTFAFGLMALYYLLFDERRGVGRWLRAAAALAFFALGWKRIGVLALVCALVFYMPLRHLSERALRRALPLLALGALLCCMGYVWAISTGAFGALMSALSADMGGRLELWAAFAGSYTFGPLFRGWGIGYTTRTVTILTQEGVGIFGLHSYGGLHNDILTLYIELGFVGFGLLIWQMWFVRPAKALSRFGRRVSLLLLCETAYVFITYTTDNTAFYCCVNTVFMLLCAACACGEENLAKGSGQNDGKAL